VEEQESMKYHVILLSELSELHETILSGVSVLAQQYVAIKVDLIAFMPLRISRFFLSLRTAGVFGAKKYVLAEVDIATNRAQYHCTCGEEYTGKR